MQGRLLSQMVHNDFISRRTLYFLNYGFFQQKLELLFPLPLKASQNHRMIEVGRDLWQTRGPTPLLKQGHLELVARDCIQEGF